MKYLIILFFLQLSLKSFAQSLSTPPINPNRRYEKFYIDSLLTKTKSRISELSKYPASARLDTARLELNFFLGDIYRSGTKQKDSLMIVGNYLQQLSKQKNNIKYEVKALLLLEHYYRAVTQNYVEALNANYAVLALIENDKIEKDKNLWKIDYNLGTLLYYMERYEESIAYLTKAIVDFGLDEKGNYLQFSSIHQRLGESYKFDKQLDKALKSYQKALSILETNKNTASSSFGYVYNDIGVTLKHLKRYEEAIENFKKAAFYWQKIGGFDGLASAWANMADAMYYVGRYDEATVLSLKVLKSSTTFINSVKANEVLANVYEAKKDFEKSLFYQKAVIFKQDSVRKAKKISEMSALLLKTEREKLQLKAEQERVLSQQNLLMVQQKEQLNNIKNQNEKNELLQKIENNNLKRLLEINILSTNAQKKQRIQQSTIKQLKINELNQNLNLQNRNKEFLLWSLIFISFFGIALAWLNLKLRAKNKLLIQKNIEIETSLLKGQKLERKRVATELHDNLNSILASVKVSLQAIKPQNNNENNIYKNVMQMVDNATREVRQISHNMLPAELEKEGLVHALQALVIRLNMGSQTQFSLNLNGDEFNKLDQEIAFNLYTICLELCQNIQKHSEATLAQIDLQLTTGGVPPNKVVMFVSDNGKGFEKNKIIEGMGLKNIQHRAKAIGATLKIQSEIGEGTTCYLILNNF